MRLVGLGVSGWASDAAKAAEQADLFDEITADHAPKQERLYQTMDAVSDKFGRKSVRFGVRRRKE
ncbi:MAG: hypothetical protein JAY75_15740 [Candidatus Thiodiazotropha taylori]|nr:hypothetical protein [Candidatus Thiodiazotropha taylori]MCW4225947.1 hypothetical protein [Candidatus Thiodiazotropha endolucinida]MCG7882026.1 hypothetical protein [Candidatus Thiodiazotropha taylori]MCG7887515.1 hypothetical protein [Candidatus Thiodiazotropha taylori]MCG7892376.1 hypothetical protein [Candidatus Thiodiazotropha taylori]